MTTKTAQSLAQGILWRINKSGDGPLAAKVEVNCRSKSHSLALQATDTGWDKVCY